MSCSSVVLGDEAMKGRFRADHWERTRAEGMAKFVLLKGLVLMGGTMSLFFLVVTFRNVGRIRDAGLISEPALVELTHQLQIFSVACGLAAGLAGGVVTWWLSEAAYRRLKRRIDPVV